MRKAFTLIELLLALAVLAIVVGLSAVAYKSIRTQAQEVALISNQKAFLKSLEAFRATGGSMSTVFSSGLTDAQKGAALLAAVNASAGATQRENRGAVGELLATSDMVVVAKTAEDATARLVISGSTVSLANAGSGFVVVAKADVGSATVVSATDTAVAAVVATAVNAVSSGAHYATANRYLWDEDATGIGLSDTGVDGGGTTDVPPTTISGSSDLGFVYWDSVSNSAKFPYVDYVAPDSKIKIFVYRTDLKPLTVADVKSLTLTFNGTPIAVSPDYGSGDALSTSVSGIWVQVNNLNTNLKAAASWDQAGYPLSLVVVSKDETTLRGGSMTQEIVPNPTTLNEPLIAGTTFNASGDKIVIDSATTNSTYNIPVYSEIDSSKTNIGVDASLYSVTGTGSSTITYTRN